MSTNHLPTGVTHSLSLPDFGHEIKVGSQEEPERPSPLWPLRGSAPKLRKLNGETNRGVPGDNSPPWRSQDHPSRSNCRSTDDIEGPPHPKFSFPAIRASAGPRVSAHRERAPGQGYANTRRPTYSVGPRVWAGGSAHSRWTLSVERRVTVLPSSTYLLTVGTLSWFNKSL